MSAFANWTKFFFPYCDGVYHQGNVAHPIKYKDSSLYFRGSLITRAHLDWINQKYNLTAADKILLTGMSAGGKATNTWSNYVKTFVGDSSKVYTVSDSGVYINFTTMAGDATILKQVQNIYNLAFQD